MEPVSISALIYASPAYAGHLWHMLLRTTPELQTGEAEFYFVANDATDEVLTFLAESGVPHVVQTNERLTDDELAERGIARPEYMRRVYQGWNRAVMEASADCLVMLNSDHVLLPGWLAKLRARWSPDLALSPLTIEPPGERGVFRSGVGGGTGAVEGEHGRTLDAFDAEGFSAQARTLQSDHMSPGGVYMPVMVSRSAVIRAGLYPEGNLHGGSPHKVREYGDRRLFRILAEQGVRHMTYHGTVAYHFQEGEMREAA